jgi:integrase
VASFVESVNWWLRWLQAEGELKTKAAAQVPRRPERVLDVLGREEIQKLEDAARAERDKLMIRLMADTGIRVSELLGLSCGDLMERDRNHYIRIAGRSQGGGAKGDRSRLVPIPRLWRRLQRYRERGRPKDANSERIFLSIRRDRRSGDYEPLTKSGVERMVRNVAEPAGIKKRTYPHMLRHSYATWALNRGMNAIMLAQVLGRSSLVMIQRSYAHSTPQTRTNCWRSSWPTTGSLMLPSSSIRRGRAWLNCGLPATG